MRGSIAGVLLIAWLSAGCGASSPAGSEATCEANCARTSCAEPPTNAACDALCASVRGAYPNCLAQINAVSACVAAQVTFNCQDGGAIAAPGNACADEAQACLSCTGTRVACSG